ncbi:phage tail tape measure protein [Candidatus Fukatsuia endosymbiont of Tuberolachnus salignus]|uniref:phage tail tape measure protein n=1 Tax=Candidatus Fukatsuia endosymbiont of Tuberolachnus salignus TaxID=3077957 RepID=UPI00313DD11B
MSDKNLRLQVVMSAVDKVTRPLKTMQAGHKKLAAAVKSSRDALGQLNTAGSKLTAFQSLQASLKKVSTELGSARLNAQLMTQEMSGLTAPTKKQTKALDAQWKAVSQLEQKQRSETQQLQQVRAELHRMGISAKDSAGATARISRETDRYTQRLQQQTRRLKQAADQQQRLTAAKARYNRLRDTRHRLVGAGVAATGAGIAMGLPVLATVKRYRDIEDAMKGVAKQVSGLRDDNGQRTLRFHELQKAIKDTAEQQPMEQGAVDFAALVEGGARMGVTQGSASWQEQKDNLLNFACTAAKAFELPAGELAEDLGKIAGLYKIPIKNIEALGDTLNFLDDNTQSKGADIIDVLKRMGDVADKMDFRQAAALGSAFLSLGATPEIAASASKAMVRELGIATIKAKDFQEAIDRLGLDGKALQRGIAYDAVGTLQTVLAKITTLPKDQQLVNMTQIFGKQFGDDATKLGLNIEEFSRQLALTRSQKATGSMQRESEIDKDSLSAQWLLLKTSAHNTFSSLGETLRSPLLGIIAKMKAVTRKIRDWVEANPKLAATLMKIATVLAVFTVGVATLALSVAALLAPLAVLKLTFSVLGIRLLPVLSHGLHKTGQRVAWLARSSLPLLQTGLRLLSAALIGLLSPMGLVIAAIAGTALTLTRYWQPMTAFLRGLIEGFRQAAAPIKEAFAPLQPLFDWLTEKIRALFGGLSELLSPITASAQALDTAAAKGEKFGDALAAGITLALTPLKRLREGVSWLLEKLGVIEAKSTKLPQIAATQPVRPRPHYTAPLYQSYKGSYAGQYDTGGHIPRGKWGIVGEKGAEIVSGSAHILSRKKTAVMAATASMMLTGYQAMAAPLHPQSLPATQYHTRPVTYTHHRQETPVSIHAPIQIITQPNHSPQDIAREVTRQLDARERRARAQVNSLYQDND